MTELKKEKNIWVKVLLSRIWLFEFISVVAIFARYKMNDYEICESQEYPTLSGVW